MFKRIILAVLGMTSALALASPPSSEILEGHGIHFSKIGTAKWELVCTVEYSGIDRSHQYGLGMLVQVLGETVVYADVQTLSSQNRVEAEEVPGVYHWVARMTGRTISLEVTYIFEGVPEPDRGFNCTAGGGDVTMSQRLGAPVMMRQAFKP